MRCCITVRFYQKLAQAHVWWRNFIHDTCLTCLQTHSDSPEFLLNSKNVFPKSISPVSSLVLVSPYHSLLPTGVPTFVSYGLLVVFKFVVDVQLQLILLNSRTQEASNNNVYGKCCEQ